jgi:hypothetical protein
MTLIEIHREIDRASERRTQLWRSLSESRDPGLAAELKALDAELERLWQQQRELRAAIRFGERAQIVKRARTEERLERAA